VVIYSIAGARMTLTLVRLAPAIVAAAMADLPADDCAGALAPPDRWGALDARVLTRRAICLRNPPFSGDNGNNPLTRIDVV